MPCIAGPHVAPPDLGLLLPDLTFSIPTPPSFGVVICCTFETPPIPGFPVLIPVGTIFAALGAAGDAILAAIDAAVDLLNSLLDLIDVDCPLE